MMFWFFFLLFNVSWTQNTDCKLRQFILQYGHSLQPQRNPKFIYDAARLKACGISETDLPPQQPSKPQKVSAFSFVSKCL